MKISLLLEQLKKVGVENQVFIGTKFNHLGYSYFNFFYKIIEYRDESFSLPYLCVFTLIKAS